MCVEEVVHMCGIQRDGGGGGDEGGSEREVESFEMDEMRGKRKGR